MADIFRRFRGTGESFSKRFDEPTYFSFRLVFAPNHDNLYNYAGFGATYDMMPHPLFDNISDEHKFNRIVDNATIPLTDVPSSQYSALQYLINANEPTRAEMLKEFIEKFTFLQNNFPYYFQAIDGIADLLKIDPAKGQRITSDKKLTITCLEGLDLRMSYLLNLYRKIVWDDVYQRWVLPDMMRYFTLQIYLAEFRIFHVPINKGSGQRIINNKLDKLFDNKFNVINYDDVLKPIDIFNTYNPHKESVKNIITDESEQSAVETVLTTMDEMLPTWIITCEMCEFDISDITFEHLSGLDVGKDPVQGLVKFGIKVGNIKETQIYPTFRHMYLNDKNLNSIKRAKDEITTSVDYDAINKYSYPISLQIAQNRETDKNKLHIPGTPFIERANQDTIKEMDMIYPVQGKNPIQEERTWRGNLINFGKAFVKNTVDKVIDKAKVTPIPNLGFSFTELQTAIQSKDIISTLGLIRKSVTTVVNQYVMPSEKLSEHIIDTNFKELLVNLSKSTATDPNSKILAEAANIALSDRGVWEKIKDFSLATDLVGPGEVNIKKSILGADQYTNAVNIPPSSKLSSEITGETIKNEPIKSKTIELTNTIIEAAPSSQLGTKLENSPIQVPPPSKATNSKLE